MSEESTELDWEEVEEHLGRPPTAVNLADASWTFAEVTGYAKNPQTGLSEDELVDMLPGILGEELARVTIESPGPVEFPARVHILLNNT